jgi:hypothetical protein
MATDGEIDVLIADIEKKMAAVLETQDRILAPLRANIEKFHEGARLIGEYGPRCLAQWFGPVPVDGGG